MFQPSPHVGGTHYLTRGTSWRIMAGGAAFAAQKRRLTPVSAGLDSSVVRVVSSGGCNLSLCCAPIIARLDAAASPLRGTVPVSRYSAARFVESMEKPIGCHYSASTRTATAPPPFTSPVPRVRPPNPALCATPDFDEITYSL